MSLITLGAMKKASIGIVTCDGLAFCMMSYDIVNGAVPGPGKSLIEYVQELDT